MTTNKGFGSKPNIEVIPLRGTEPADIDRCISAYRRQGLSKAETESMMNVSLAYHFAEEQGMQPGIDIQFDPDKGFLMSEGMEEVMKDLVTPQKWEYMEMEQFITREPVVEEPEGDVAVTPLGLCKLLLAIVRDPSGSGVNDGGKSARGILSDLLMQSGLNVINADKLIREWIDGDDSLVDQIVERIKTSAEQIAKRQQTEDE